MSQKTYDVVVVGAGVIGLNLAIELKNLEPALKILVIDKEESIACHASGRNSGVLHAGFYYTPDSLKARYTKEGNEAWRQYCQERSLAMNRCGKLVVSRNEEEDRTLDMLFERCQKFGVTAELIDETQAKALEPRCKTFARVLWSPNSYSVNPKEVMTERLKEARDGGIEVCFSETFVSFGKSVLKTSKRSAQAKFLVNAAGAYADKIAKTQGLSKDYAMLPYKGLYLYSSELPGELNRHIYPVPDLRNPFLGVHFTLTVEGKIKIGPTATPAFWREQYSGLDNFALSEFWEAALGHAKICLLGPSQVRRLAVEESLKLFKSYLVKSAQSLLNDVEEEHFKVWGKPGIRAQLVNKKKNELVMDFVVEEGEDSLHVLNSISPAFTSAIPFCRDLSQRSFKLLNQS